MNVDSRRVSSAAAGSVDGGRVTKRGWNSQFLIGGALLAVIVLFQWPMLKGMFYKVAGLETPRSAVAWRDDFDSAKVEAAASGKPILLVFSASWCPACMVMEHEVWSDAAVGDVANERFIPVHIDVDDRDHVAVARRYQVGAIPTVLIVDSQGEVLREAASMSRSRTLSFLQQESEKNSQG